MKTSASRAVYARSLAALAFSMAAAASATASAATSGQCGMASWYAMTSKTASGERANPNMLTAAHRSLPFGTVVTVINLDNGRQVKVRINDRGPFARSRVIDVTRQAANELGFTGKGTARVKVVGPHGNTLRAGKHC
ncbi:septal ring lytic transglycosylase RlpA family protein [Pannonibacter phragmitetus]|nr:septal ring lytic transglycosylase RlpA family protein [Pannonibacter phragmitetus]